jgi:CheY-like chemotaxis protein
MIMPTILVVDDEPAFVELVSDLLSGGNHRIFSAQNGALALAFLDTQSVDIIISDIEMPVMDGIAFHTALQNDPKKKDIPFVFLSGTEDPEFVHYVEQHPPAAYVRKEHPLTGLLSVVSSLTAAVA